MSVEGGMADWTYRWPALTRTHSLYTQARAVHLGFPQTRTIHTHMCCVSSRLPTSSRYRYRPLLRPSPGAG